MIPFKIKLLTETAKAPTQENEGDLWDLYADDFSVQHIKDLNKDFGIINLQKYPTNTSQKVKLYPQGRILVKTGIAIQLPIRYDYDGTDAEAFWDFDEQELLPVLGYAVADIRPRSGLALKHGITVLNTPGTIDNSYRKEIGVILYNAGHEPYTITKGDKIAQMLIRPLYPSKLEIVENIEDTGRGGYGSTGK